VVVVLVVVVVVVLVVVVEAWVTATGGSEYLGLEGGGGQLNQYVTNGHGLVALAQPPLHGLSCYDMNCSDWVVMMLQVNSNI
jgi:hypothetical protein